MAMIIAGTAVAVSMAAVAAAGGGTIAVPPGTWTGFFDVQCSNVWFRGESNRASIMQFASAGAETWIVRGEPITTPGAAWRRQIRFSDIGFDAVGGQFCVNGAGYNGDEWIFERCRFINFTGGYAFFGSQLSKCRFIECEFYAPGTALGVGAQFGDACSDVIFDRCRFYWTGVGVVVDTGAAGETPSSRFTIRDCYFQSDYWLIKAYANVNATGSGATVSYTPTTLVDTSKDFTLIPLDNQRTIRVMAVLATSTTTSIGRTVVIDAAQDFRLLGVAYGDLLRTATAFAKVVAVDATNGTKLYVQDWFDLTTYEPTAPPASGTAYTLYGIVLGETKVVAATTITVERWRDLRGNTVATPAAQTLFEILGERSLGAVRFEDGCSDVLVAGCYSSGNWSDQYTVSGARSFLVNCAAYDGQDGGATIRGDGTQVIGGQWVRNGAAGIFITGDDATIMNAYFEDNGTEYFVTDINAQILMFESDRCLIQGNTMRAIDNPRALYGIALRGVAPCTGNRIYDNAIRDMVTAQFLFENAAETRLRDNDR